MIQPALLGLCRILVASLAISCLHSPISWSPDGRWFAYTTVESSNLVSLRPGWLCDLQSIAPIMPGSPVLLLRGQPSGTFRYRIWALERSTQRPVLIDESESPLSSPVWGPDGRALSYCRLVPRSAETGWDRFRGRCELVLREALDRQRVIIAFPEVELDAPQLQAFIEARAAWSPDGQHLAVFRPGPAPSVVIVAPQSGRLVAKMDRSSLPSWSPDGARVAMLMSAPGERNDQILQLYERDLKSKRLVGCLGELSEPPAWSPDGQSLWMVATQPSLRRGELELIRIAADSGVATRILTVGRALPGGHASNHPPAFDPDEEQLSTQQCASVAFDHDFEQCALSLGSPGQSWEIACYHLRRRVPYKRFHPVDPNLPIGALAMHPDGQVVAIRIESPGGSAPLLLCEPENESIRLVAPDATTRREWLTTLIGVARGLFQILPQPSFDGQGAVRATVLPAPAEIIDQNSSSIRQRHIGKLGKALLGDLPPGPGSVDDSTAALDDECRLFFNYLRSDFKQAEAELDLVAARAAAPAQRFALLALRAQILMGQGLIEAAQAVIDYLLHSESSASQRVEETPAGSVVTTADGPGRIWACYLARTVSVKSTAGTSLPGDLTDTTDARIDSGLRSPAAILRRKANASQINNLLPLPRLRVPVRGPEELFPRGEQRVFPPLPPKPAEPGPPRRLAP